MALYHLSNALTEETDMEILTQSNLTCPECDFAQRLEMPTDSCQFFYECPNCGSLLKPKAGDCCVFCSYGDVPCPPIQIERQQQ